MHIRSLLCCAGGDTLADVAGPSSDMNQVPSDAAVGSSLSGLATLLS
jgi:hypothetical protein